MSERPSPNFFRDAIPALDGLRLVAVGLVMWYHMPWDMFAGAWGGGGLNRRLIGYLQVGNMGVDIFFVLSGFLITRLLLAEKERNGAVALGKFYVRRSLRIFPIYYLLLAVLWVIVPERVWAGGSGGGLWAAVYLYNFYAWAGNAPDDPLGHLWSLAVEEHFYLLWPWVVALVPIATCRRAVVWVLLPLIVVAALVTALVWTAVDPGPAGVERLGHFMYRFTGFRALSLLAGAVLAFSEPSLRAARVSRALGLAGLIFVLGVLIGLLLPIGADRQLFPFRRLASCTLASTGIVLAVVAMRSTRFAAYTVAARPAVELGRISYGLYLYHVPIFLALGVNHDTPPSAAVAGRCIAALALTFVVAGLSSWLIERPILRLKDRFAA